MNSLPEQQAFLIFNHHVGGAFVLFMGVISLLETMQPAKYSRFGYFWPISLLILGGYMILLSDPAAWPIGPMSITDSLANPTVLQHKTFAVIMVALGGIDFLRRLDRLTTAAWQLAFYAIALIPGIALLVHSMASLGPHHSQTFLFSHPLMGILALATLIAKVLVDAKVITGQRALAYPLLILLLGLQLFLYEE